jgi:hypothetical protein
VRGSISFQIAELGDAIGEFNFFHIDGGFQLSLLSDERECAGLFFFNLL